MPTLSERLKELRARAEMTQQDLARKSGVPLQSVRNYEHGIREPSWIALFRLARALGVSCDAFADCVPDAEPKKTRSRRPQKR